MNFLRILCLRQKARHRTGRKNFLQRGRVSAGLIYITDTELHRIILLFALLFRHFEILFCLCDLLTGLHQIVLEFSHL